LILKEEMRVFRTQLPGNQKRQGTGKGKGKKRKDEGRDDETDRHRRRKIRVKALMMAQILDSSVH